MSRLYDQIRRAYNDIDNMTVVSADNVAEYIYDKYGVYKESWKDAPCLAPTLNPVWIETLRPKNAPEQLPHVWATQLSWVQGHTDIFGAFMELADSFRTPKAVSEGIWQSGYNKAHWLMCATLSVSQGGRLYAPDCFSAFPLDEAGALIRGGMFFNVPVKGGYCEAYQLGFHKRQGFDSWDAIRKERDAKGEPLVYDEAPKFGQADFISDCLYPMFNVTLMGLALMHCKNVELIDQPPPPKLSKSSQKKYGMPLVTYKVLKVTPMRKVYQFEGEQGNTEQEPTLHPLHICRGHFKDFRNGKGLFGKYKDIYWWDQHLRGNEEAGIAVKDYSVEPPEAS